jgi:uncharacterized protein (DUF1778 family)
MEKQSKSPRNPDRTVLLICCTRDEADRIRAAARIERRTISAFVINAVLTRFAAQDRIQQKRKQRSVTP